MNDELLDDLDQPLFEAFFQFDEDIPISFAKLAEGKDLTIKLVAENIDNPSLTFNNGAGKSFKIFLHPCEKTKE